MLLNAWLWYSLKPANSMIGRKSNTPFFITQPHFIVCVCVLCVLCTLCVCLRMCEWKVRVKRLLCRSECGPNFCKQSWPSTDYRFQISQWFLKSRKLEQTFRKVEYWIWHYTTNRIRLQYSTIYSIQFMIIFYITEYIHLLSRDISYKY